jgi:hypothetical protein
MRRGGEPAGDEPCTLPWVAGCLHGASSPVDEVIALVSTVTTALTRRNQSSTQPRGGLYLPGVGGEVAGEAIDGGLGAVRERQPANVAPVGLVGIRSLH